MNYGRLSNPYQSNIDWIMVQNLEQVDKVAVQPNCKAWIMVQNEPIFALRTADAMGLITSDYYKFEKYEKPTPSYVTSEQLTQALEELEGALNESITNATEASNKRAKPTNDKKNA